jgi:hypothetical protein
MNDQRATVDICGTSGRNSAEKSAITCTHVPAHDSVGVILAMAARLGFVHLRSSRLTV